jgi:hypothetical protein
MSDTVKPKKRWFLKAELTVLLCIFCIWIIKLMTADIDSTKAAILKQAVSIWSNVAEVSDKARENSTNFNELHSVPLLNKEKINDDTTKSESKAIGLVSGIFYSKDKQSAVINNKIVVYEGDTIDGVTIVKIYKDKVEFTKNGKNWVQKVTKGNERFLLKLIMRNKPSVPYIDPNNRHNRLAEFN